LKTLRHPMLETECKLLSWREGNVDSRIKGVFSSGINSFSGFVAVVCKRINSISLIIFVYII
jgi:hypothetical protein